MKTQYSLIAVTLMLFSPLVLAETTTDSNATTTTKAESTQPISDTAITTKVKAKIMGHKGLSGFTIDVTTNNGVVTLAGNVDSDSQASELIELAQATDGVQDVNAADLQVKESTQPFEDMLITSKIKGKFIREKLFGDKEIAAMSIHVETNNGIVYLTGTADSKQQADNAIALAKSVNGVKSVESTVSVEGTKTAASS